MGDGTLLTLGAASALAIGTALTRRGSRATPFPFLFRSYREESRRIRWNLPPEVVAAAWRNVEEPVPPTGERVLVYAAMEGPGQLRRAIDVLPVIDADASWRMAWVRLDGLTVFGELQGLNAKDAAGVVRSVYAFELPPGDRLRAYQIRRLGDVVYGEGDDTGG